MTSVPASSVQHQTSQCVPPLQFLTPDPHLSQSLEYTVQVQSVQRNAENPGQVQSVQRNAEYPVQVQSLQRTPLADVDMLLNTEVTDTVEIGGCGNVQLGRNDYIFVKVVSKPSGMALRLADKLFLTATLLWSTVHGTKDFVPLDPTIIFAIKGL